MGRSLDLVHVIYADTLPMDGGMDFLPDFKGGEYDPSTSIAGKRHVSRRLSLGEVGERATVTLSRP